MSDTGKQSPLGSNVLADLLQNKGLRINPRVTDYAGQSKYNAQYVLGKIPDQTCLRLLTYAINEAYKVTPTKISPAVYNNLISIGADSIPILGNSKPPGYVAYDPANRWVGQSNTGYAPDIAPDFEFSHDATWLPYKFENKNNGITQWGFIRDWALQAWQEFNWNGISPKGEVRLKDYCGSFMTSSGYLEYVNSAIYTLLGAETSQIGTFSNYNAHSSGDITDVTTALIPFGNDCISVGNAIDLTKIDKFGLPSILLQKIFDSGLMVPSLSIALVSSGLTANNIDTITAGIVRPPASQEKQIYRSFLLIVGNDLKEILTGLNCTLNVGTGPTDVRSLADLLDVRRLFPNSWNTITVPLYNYGIKQVSNSKVLYLIQDAVGKDESLFLQQLGLSIPEGEILPPSSNATATDVIQIPRIGFGAYLDNILPTDVAKYAGAFSVSIQQINNNKLVNFPDLAKMIPHVELATGAGVELTPSIVSGYQVPADVNLVTKGKEMISIGSGPYGTYRMADFMGCMSTEPYPWETMYNYVLQLQTNALANIYANLYLAVTSSGAQTTVTQTAYVTQTQQYIAPEPIPNTDPVQYTTGQDAQWNWYYKVTNVSLTPVGNVTTSGSDTSTVNIYTTTPGSTAITPPTKYISGSGGGYGRGGAPSPSVTITPNNVGAAGGVTSINTDSSAVPGNFGRVVSLTNINYGGAYMYDTMTTQSNTPPTASSVPMPVEHFLLDNPPTVGNQNMPPNIPSAMLMAAAATGSLDAIVQAYIDQANAEISSIYAGNKSQADMVNTLYSNAGAQLAIEQRARWYGIAPVNAPRDDWMNAYPTALIAFTDAIPDYSQKTEPWMQATTLRLIRDTDVGGNSIEAMMRQERNQTRLDRIGIKLTNNIADALPVEAQKIYMGNGTLTPPFTAIPGTAPEFIPTPILLTAPDINPYTQPSYTGFPGPGNAILSPTPAGWKPFDRRPFVVTNPYYGQIYPNPTPWPPRVIIPPNPELWPPGPTPGEIVPPNEDIYYMSRYWPRTSHTVDEAINNVVQCNCDCWLVVQVSKAG